MALSTICRIARNNNSINKVDLYCNGIWRRMRSPNLTTSSINERNFVATNPRFKCPERNSVDSTKAHVDDQGMTVWTIPNLLCGLRIAASPVLSYCIIEHSYTSAVGILIVAGLTDLADGHIARNYKGQSSRLGTFLDPLADKVLIITLYTSMVFADLVPALLMGIIVFRDVLLLLAGIYIRYISIPPPRTIKKFCDNSSRAKLQPTYLSKVNTVLQITIAIISLCAPTTEWITQDVLSFSWYTAGLSTIISGLSYVFSKKTFVISKNSTKTNL